MTDDFDELFTDEELEAEAAVETPASTMSGEEEERLRRLSTRASSAQQAMDEGSSGFSWRSFSPAQRLILAVLLLLNIIVISFGILVVTGRFTL